MNLYGMKKFRCVWLNPIRKFIFGWAVTPNGFTVLSDPTRFVETGGTNIGVWLGWVLLEWRTKL